MNPDRLFEPLQLGVLHLAHRVVMAPLTRLRATVVGNTANQLMATYYSQRATKDGLIITEGSHISPDGQPVHASPGIYTHQQINGWKQVTKAVHSKGGKIFLQLWHVGRVSHSSFQPNNALPVGASPIAISGDVLTKSGITVPYECPKELTLDEIQQIVMNYQNAAKNALDAGFDGVEIHAANGWLLEQFLQSNSNKRTDVYGGSIDNRCRLILQVVDAVCKICNSNRVGIRLSPFGRINDSGETDPMPLYTNLISLLDSRALAYLHLVEPRSSGAAYKDVDHRDMPEVGKLFRNQWKGKLIVAGNYNRESAIQVVSEGHADAVAFGRLFISNPDLPARLKNNNELTMYDRSTFYQGGEKGYIDYTSLTQGCKNDQR